MKQLTMNRLAFAGVKANKKEYRQMALGIFFAVFLTVATALGVWSFYEKRLETKYQHFGKADGFLFGAIALESEALEKSGQISQIGTITVLGTAREAPSLSFGYGNETAEALLCRQFLTGHLPQSASQIALSDAARDALCPGAQVGSTVTLELTPRSTAARKRSFTLVGIFRDPEVRDYDLFNGVPSYAATLPTILVSPEVPEFQGIRPLRHFVFTFSKDGSLSALAARFPSVNLVGIDALGAPYQYQVETYLSRSFLLRLECAAPVLLAGGALLLAAMIGIFIAVSGQFSRKEQQYRLLRAVGATKRQVAAVSCREALILALLLTPAAGGCAVLFVKLCCGLVPDIAAFALPPRLIGFSLLVSFFLVWVAASVPVLWSLRGGPLRSKEKYWHRRSIRSKRCFVPSKLLARRGLFRHPFRSVGILLLIVLMNITSALLFINLGDRISTIRQFEAQSAFEIEQTSLWGDETVLDETHLEALRSLPGVTEVSLTRCAPLYAMADAVGTYYPRLRSSQNYHLYNYRPELKTESILESIIRSDQQLHTNVEKLLDTASVSLSGFLLTVEDLSTLSPYLLDGTIDADKIDAGEALLLFAPTYYTRTIRNGHSFSYTRTTKPIKQYDEIIENDQFPVGTALSLGQIEPDPRFKSSSNKTIRKAEATVCGVLDEFNDFMVNYSGSLVFITTPQGAKKLGLNTGSVQKLSIEMDESKVSDTQLEKQINDLINENGEYYLENSIQRARNARRDCFRDALFLGSLTLAFLGCVVAMLRGCCSRDMQAEKETISILWSLGCEEQDLTAIWKRQFTLLALAALPLSLLAEFFLMDPGYLIYNQGAMARALVANLTFSTLAPCLCRAGLQKMLQSNLGRPV